jgi:hypothetical protein
LGRRSPRGWSANEREREERGERRKAYKGKMRHRSWEKTLDRMEEHDEGRSLVVVYFFHAVA